MKNKVLTGSIIIFGLIIVYLSITFDLLESLSLLLIIMTGFTSGVITLYTRDIIKREALKFLGISLFIYVVFNLLIILHITTITNAISKDLYHLLAVSYLSVVVFFSVFIIKQDKLINIRKIMLIEIIISIVLIYIISSELLIVEDANLLNLIEIIISSLIILGLLASLVKTYFYHTFEETIKNHLLIVMSLLLVLSILALVSFTYSEFLLSIVNVSISIVIFDLVLKEGVKNPYSTTVEELEKSTDQVSKLVRIDHLTDIPNRFYLFENLDKTLRFSKRENQTIVMILVDIDDFSGYNDTFGHQHGDSILKRIAKTIQNECKRPLDFAGRFGGEEFLGVLPNSTFEGGHVVCQRIQKKVRELGISHFKNKKEFLTVSIGFVAFSPTQETSIDFPLKELDTCLMHVKQTGKNNYYGRNLDEQGE